MISAAIILAFASTFTVYPGQSAREPRIEAITDRGPIVELIVRCPTGTAIMSYSKLEGLYCTARHPCTSNLDTAIRNGCGR